MTEPTTEQCHYMAAAYPTLDGHDTCTEHRHESRVFDLARAFATEFQQPEPSDAQIAWFLDDADAILDDFDPTPSIWTVTDLVSMPKELRGIDNAFKVNGVDYVIQAAEWVPAHPVRRTTYQSWIEEDA